MLSNEIINDIIVLTVDVAKIDMHHARKFHEELCNSVKQYDKVILNLDKLENIDSSGLGAIMVFLKEIQIKQAILVLTNVHDAIVILFKLNKMDHHFKILDNNEEAIEYIKKGH
jgi:anti-anti-sigma factor